GLPSASWPPAVRWDRRRQHDGSSCRAAKGIARADRDGCGALFVSGADRRCALSGHRAPVVPHRGKAVSSSRGLPDEPGSKISRSCRATRCSWEKFDAVAETSQLADHLARSPLLRLFADGWPTFLIPNALVGAYAIDCWQLDRNSPPSYP